MKMRLIKPLLNDTVNVIIETPKNSNHKYIYDAELEIFKLKKVLPLGFIFPFDFGFIPNTKAPDGDPLDVLIIMDETGISGCLVECRLIGVLEASQKEKDGQSFRNDRLVAVACSTNLYQKINDTDQLSTSMTTAIEDFFIDYNRHEHKIFTPIGWQNSAAALQLIKDALVDI